MCGSTLRAELTPEEVAIVAVKTEASRAVAKYYSRVRKVPSTQVLTLDIPTQQDISYEDWSNNVRPQIQRWLNDNELQDKIRCFVTVWDVPLRIKKASSASAQDTVALLRYLREERASRVGRINAFLDTLVGMAPSADQIELQPLAGDANLEDIKTTLEQALGAAQAAVLKISDSQEKQQRLQQLQTIYISSLGLNMMTQSLGRQVQQGAANNEVRSQFDGFRGRVLGLRQGRAAIEGTPISLERDTQLLALVELTDGLFGSITWINEQEKTLTRNETYSSFDSELSLVLWPEYEALRWQPNYLHYRFDDSPIRRFRPTIMVSRLEAPSLKMTRRIIDDAIAVEKTGLSGKVYLDGRGLAKLDDPVQPGTYQDFDRAVVLAAELIKNHTDLEVVLDTKQALFQEGDCPDAAIYCGWYSLAKYVDAFEWKPGAVAYHMASSEATTLRSPNSQVWCKRMLEDGVTATLGPAFEPYISAFPRPNEFLPLLLSGKFTLVESYYRTKPFNSWTMLLVGDPLYSPFRASPALRMDGLDRSVRRILDGPGAMFDSDVE